MGAPPREFVVAKRVDGFFSSRAEFAAMVQSVNVRREFQTLRSTDRVQGVSADLWRPGNVDQLLAVKADMSPQVPNKVKVDLVIKVKDPKGGKPVVRVWRFAFKPIREFWTFCSVRPDTAKLLPWAQIDPAFRNAPYPAVIDYPIDEGEDQIPSSQFAPDAVRIGDEHIDKNKKTCLVSLHGYNVNIDEAEDEFNEEYQRLWWAGWRGNFVGLTWHGDFHAKGEDAIPSLCYPSKERSRQPSRPTDRSRPGLASFNPLRGLRAVFEPDAGTGPCEVQLPG